MLSNIIAIYSIVDYFNVIYFCVLSIIIFTVHLRRNNKSFKNEKTIHSSSTMIIYKFFKYKIATIVYNSNFFTLKLSCRYLDKRKNPNKGNLNYILNHLKRTKWVMTSLVLEWRHEEFYKKYCYQKYLALLT